MLPIRTIFEADIDFQTYGIEVISDAYKFILPIPKLQEKLIIKNYTDQSNQSVAVDGTGIIIFNFGSKEDAESISPKIEQLINEQLEDTKDINALTAQRIRNIVGKAHTQLKLNDIYPTNKDFVRDNLKLICGATEFYGLHQRNITDYCKAVYIKGSGKFLGPTTQKFTESAVIVQHNGSCRLVQTDIFLKTYRNTDHSKIQKSELEKNQISVSQLKEKLVRVKKEKLRQGKQLTHIKRLASKRLASTQSRLNYINTIFSIIYIIELFLHTF